MSNSRKAKLADRRVRLCIRNDGYPASLERHKIYEIVPDAAAAKLGLLRVIDELGEDYLYPREFFTTVRLEPEVKAELLAA